VKKTHFFRIFLLYVCENEKRNDNDKGRTREKKKDSEASPIEIPMNVLHVSLIVR